LEEQYIEKLSDEENTYVWLSCPYSSVISSTTLDRNVHFRKFPQLHNSNAKDKKSVHVFHGDNSKLISYMPACSSKNITRMFFNFLNTLSNVELLVWDLTSIDLCMPNDEAMAEVDKLTFDYLALFKIMRVIKHRSRRICMNFKSFEYESSIFIPHF